jgi:GAF domain-containing protein
LVEGQLRRDIGPIIASVERDLLAMSDVHRTLDRVVALAVGHLEEKRLEGPGYVSVSLVGRRRRVVTASSSHEAAARADDLQYTLDQGPCLDAIWRRDVSVVDDLRADGRYPRWSQRAVADTGIRSALSLRLFTRRDSLGALNLYASTPYAFTPEDLAEGAVFAAQAAVALRSSQLEEQLRASQQSRTTIGQAQGILMERYQISAERAFEMLRRVSQDSNVRPATVAARLVGDRRTPGT